MEVSTVTDKPQLHKLLYWAGIFAILSAATTVLLSIFSVPYPSSFEAQVQLANDARYLTSKWVLFLHPQLTFLSFTGLAALYWRSHPQLVVPAMLFAGVWAFSELLQQGFLIEGLNNVLRVGYSQASDPARLQELRTAITTIEAISDSFFFVLLFAIGFAYMLLGICVSMGAPRNRWLAAGMAFLALASFLSFSGYYLVDAPILLAWSDYLFEWGYVWIAPLFRAYLGIWLIQQSRLKMRGPV